MTTSQKIQILKTKVQAAELPTLDNRLKVSKSCRQLYELIHRDFLKAGKAEILPTMYAKLKLIKITNCYVFEQAKKSFFNYATYYYTIVTPILKAKNHETTNL